jgi:hypothetical protein
MKSVRSFLLPAATIAALILPAIAPAASPEPINRTAVQAQPQQQNGITYLSGGIGEDESRAIQQSTGYNLHMTFSIGTENKYVSNVDLIIQNAQKQTVLTLSQTGPLVYVQLPAGHYSIVTTLEGQERREAVDIGGGAARTLNFHWNGPSDSAGGY